MNLPSQTVRTVLFDLDGTLADTAPDLANALNHALQADGRPPLPFEQIRPVVSNGAAALIKLGFRLDSEADEYPAILDTLLGHYRDNIATDTRLFPGMSDVLEKIEDQGRNWGVVTNKPARLTEPLMQALGLSERAVCIISGDTLSTRKPDPAPMHLASQLAGSSPAECLYVGDAERDIEAGRRAGMLTLAALFGYINTQDQPEHWGADGLIESPTDILSWLNPA